MVNFRTHCTNTLDLILTDLTPHHFHLKLRPPIGHRTHLSVLLTPVPTKYYKTLPVTNTYSPVTDSATCAFGQWITRHRWIEVLRVDDVHLK